MNRMPNELKSADDARASLDIVVTLVSDQKSVTLSMLEFDHDLVIDFLEREFPSAFHVRLDDRLFELADYPVLESLARPRTEALMLDGRACIEIYKAGLGGIDVTHLSSAERAFMARLGLLL